MNKPLAILIGLGLLAVLVLFSTTYSVSFHEVAVKKRFGQSTQDDVVVEPGLQFKLPMFADQVAKYDTRLQMIESPLETIHTADGQQVVVRAYMLWRIDKDPARVQLFDTNYRSMDGANAFINDRFRSALLAGLSPYRFNELIGPDSRLDDAEQAILTQLAPLEDTGIRPVAVGISHIQFPPRTSQAVLARMQATRETLARNERTKGQAEAQRIESEARTMADRIRAFAEQRAAEIRASGDLEAERYISLMAEEPELAIFLSWLDTLEMGLSERTTMILESGHAPMHLLNFRSPLSARGIPHPSSTYAHDLEQEALRTALQQSGANSPTDTLQNADSKERGEEESDDTDPSLADKRN